MILFGYYHNDKYIAIDMSHRKTKQLAKHI